MLGPPLWGLPVDGGSDRFDEVVEGWWATTVSGVGTVVPDGAVDLLAVAGSVPFVAGPDRVPRPVDLPVGAHLVGLRLRPGVAASLVADGVDRAVGRQVDLGTVWSRVEVERLLDELGRCEAGPGEAGPRVARVLARSVARRVGPDWRPDPAVAATVDAIRLGAVADDGGAGPLDRDLGLGHRQLRRRFAAAMGYGPTFYRRIVRLDRFTDLLAARPSASLGELAAEAGFYDQAHLGRDCRQLLGTTPARLRSGG